MKTLKLSIGIDVAKDTIVCCMGSLNAEGQISFSKPQTFSNDLKGFGQLIDWAEAEPGTEMLFVMEATGVYYEGLAYWLDGMSKTISVLLPGKVKHYGRSLNIKTKTDGIDAQLLSRMGLERKLDCWHMPSKAMRTIKFLSREYKEIKAKLVVSKNQLHAKTHSYGCPSSVIKRLNQEIGLLETQLLEIEAELRTAAMSDTALYDRINKVTTLPGVGFMTVIGVLAETNAFALVRNARQLVSYAGLDIKLNQSGLKEGKTRISKQGNSFIRSTLYMPALCASRHNPELNRFYKRLNERKPAKKIGITAVARKLLILIYTLWKNNEEFNPDITKENKQTGLRLSAQDEQIVLL